MIELIQRYYSGERHTALVAMVMGVGLLLVALLLWRNSAVVSLPRGLAHVFLIAGLFYSCAGFGYTFVASNRAVQATQRYSGHSESDIKQQETTRMRQVLRSSFNGGLVIHTLLILGGLGLLVLSMDVPTRKGVALALMVIGVLGHCVEAFSMQFNRQYLQAVEALPVG